MRNVRVLIVEDEAEKRELVTAEVIKFFGEALTLTVSETFADATQKILKTPYDLIVVDLLLPRRIGEQPVDVSEDMIDHLSNSDANKMTTVVAISRFDEVVTRRHSAFSRAGIFLIKYSNREEWKSCLKVCMQKVTFRTVYDFVIICALELERAAFEGVKQHKLEYGELINQHGLNAREISIGDLKGVCVLQPHMGLVDASIVTARSLDAFNPKLVCMSGICGGFSPEVKLGALIVSDVSWEHQAGKWRGDEFEIRSFHESVDNDVRTILSQMIEKDPELQSLSSKPHEVAVPKIGAVLRPTTSGSAVIASTQYSEHIKKQHGKVSGVDMEVFGVYRAAALHAQPVICFAAKTVVDLANEAKGDDLQHGGAILSARFVAKAIQEILQ